MSSGLSLPVILIMCLSAIIILSITTIALIYVHKHIQSAKKNVTKVQYMPDNVIKVAT